MVVDAEGHAVYKFSNDGKKLLLTLGTPRQRGDDDTHFNRPPFLVFMRLVYMPVSGFSSRTYVAIPFDVTAGRSVQNNGTPRGGMVLWEVQTGQRGMGPPVTYQLDGKQHISFLGGTGGASGQRPMVYTFVVDGKALMPTTASR